MERPGLLETGVWLTRSSRRQGVGGAAMAAALFEAGSLGFTAVQAETTADNAGAVAVLEQLGFDLTPIGEGRAVQGLLVLEPQL